jgi:deazaflavin-dependent oxidoreductase (nitroreductase family)
VTAPRPRTLLIRPITNHVINPVARPFIHLVPGFALMIHRGRRSGTVHRAPVKFFRDGADYVFALTYGSEANWVRNVVAAGAVDLRIGNRIIHLGSPEVFVDRRRSLMPAPVRLFLRLLGVTEFLRMRPAAGERGAGT